MTGPARVILGTLDAAQTPDELRLIWKVYRAIHRAFGDEELLADIEAAFKTRAADLGLKWKGTK